jgi:MFS family permease
MNPASADSFKRPFAVIFVVLVIIGAGNTALISVAPAIGRSLDLPDAAVAGLLSASSLLWASTSPMWAAASDRKGRKSLILLGMAGFALSLTLFGAAVVAGLHGVLVGAGLLAALGLSRCLFGFLGAAAPPAAQALVAENTTPAQRLNALALFASAFGLGTVLGPAITPFLTVEPLGLPGPSFIFAGVAVLVACLAWRELPADQPSPVSSGPATVTRSAFALWRDPKVGPYLVFGFLVTSAQALNLQSIGFLVLDRTGLPPGQAQGYIGGAMMGGALAGLFMQWGLIRWLRPRSSQLLAWGVALACTGNLLLALAHDFTLVTIGYAVANLGYAAARPGFTAGSSLAVGLDEQGAVAGQVNALVGAAYIFAPVVGMSVYGLWAPGAYLLNATLLAGLIVFALKSRTLRAGEAVA